MKFVFSSKFIFWNFIALMVIKTGFAYPAYQLTSLISGSPAYSKSEVITETNEFRASIGAYPLRESVVLNVAAAQKLQDMERNQYFAHYSPGGVSPWYWFGVNKYSYSYAGENLAIGFLDAQSTVQAWSNSSSHRKNMASLNFQEIGVAVSETKIKDIQGYVVVQFFGTPSTPKPSPTVSTAPKLGLGFSGASAKTPTPLPKTPVPTAIAPSPTPTSPPATATPAVIGQESTSTPMPKTSPVVPIAAKETLSDQGPINVVNMSPAVNSVARVLDKGFLFYSLLVALGSVVYLMMAGARKELFLKTALNFAMFLLALAVPLIEVSRTALILGAYF